MTILYNPQQNGVAKAKNRSIIETTKSMIHNLDPCMCLWVEVCLTIVYILNRGSHRVLNDKTQEESSIGEKPQVSHLRVFGCPIYIHIPDEK